MIGVEKLAAFAAVTALVSVVPGPNMLFVLAQAAWRGRRGGWLALSGLQLGNLMWFVLAGLGLSTLLAASPWAFRAAAVGGALYLAWLGVQAWRHAGAAEEGAGEAPPRRVSQRPLRDGMVVALSNPKSLIYVAALLPPFVDPRGGVAGQLALLAVVGVGIDVAIGLAYIVAGHRLAAAMARPVRRRLIERCVGAAFVAIAAGVVASLVG